MGEKGHGVNTKNNQKGAQKGEERMDEKGEEKWEKGVRAGWNANAVVAKTMHLPTADTKTRSAMCVGKWGTWGGCAGTKGTSGKTGGTQPKRGVLQVKRPPPQKPK